ncbi:hypothetical protein BDW72DRAFT_81228 [Aspergillus terricola var. indicus]
MEVRGSTLGATANVLRIPLCHSIDSAMDSWSDSPMRVTDAVFWIQPHTSPCLEMTTMSLGPETILFFSLSSSETRRVCSRIRGLISNWQILHLFGASPGPRSRSSIRGQSLSRRSQSIQAPRPLLRRFTLLHTDRDSSCRVHTSASRQQPSRPSCCILPNSRCSLGLISCQSSWDTQVFTASSLLVANQ